MNQIVQVSAQLPSAYYPDADRMSFLAYLKASGRRPTTVQTYEMALRSIYRTMASEGDMIDPRFITPDDIVHLRQVMTVCDSSKKLYLIVLGRFCKYFTGRNPREDAELLWNDDDRKRKFITPEQYHYLKASADPEQGLMLALGANMGLRRCEIAGVRLSDIDNGYLIVHGKGHGPEGKVSRLFIPPAVQDAMRRYMPVRMQIVSKTGSTDDHLLLKDTKLYAGHCHDSRSVGDRLGVLARRCGVDMTPHSLRRLYATVMYDGGTDLNTLRLMMRHQDISTTMKCYINVSASRIGDAVRVVSSVLG
jgi:integrase